MNIEFEPIGKPYYVLVNKKELYEQALALGYEKVILTAQDRLDEEDIGKLKATGKHALWFVLCSDDSSWGEMSIRELKGKKQAELKFTLPWSDPPEGLDEKDFLSFAVRSMPTPEYLEEWLRDEGYLLIEDYTGKCGNCHAALAEGDHYCKYCGTRRGEGKFLPYRNEVYCVYGPPVKKKYKCGHCGYLWITSALGGDHFKYCPMCGTEVISVIEDKCLDMFHSFVGREEPYEHKPVLFSEDELNILLSCRDNNKEKDKYVSNEDIFDALTRAGIEVPVAETEPDEPDDGRVHIRPRTEKQGEQLSLAYIVLSLNGEDLHGCRDAVCPHCGSTCAAAYTYDILDERGDKLSSNEHAPTEAGGLLYRGDYAYFRVKSRAGAPNCPAYICLQCGTDFGKFSYPANNELL